jgi:sugar porter (SP) family MFS transporter
MICQDQSINNRPFSWLSMCLPLTDNQFAALSSLFVIGGGVGALSAGHISNMKGRLFGMQMTGICFVVGSIIQTLSPTFSSMLLGRVISGLGSGAATVIVPLYISEIAPSEKKGTFGVVTQISINVGILGTQIMGYFFSRVFVWRWIMAFGVLVGFTHLFSLFFAAESPEWLAAHRSTKIAMETLQRIRGAGYDISSEVSHWALDANLVDPSEPLLRRRASVSSCDQHSSTNNTNHVSVSDVFKNPSYRLALIAVIGVMLVQQVTGINSIMLYSVSLLDGVLPISSSLLTILVSVVNLLATVALSPCPDRFGRKKTLLVSIISMGSMSFLLALSLLLGWKFIAAIAVLAFVAAFAGGLGPVPFMMASELVGPEASGAVQSVALGASYFGTLVIAQGFPILNTFLNNALGGQGYVYFVFAGFAVASASFVASYVPETKGKSVNTIWGLEERID